MSNHTLPNLKNLPYGGAQYIVSSQTEDFVRQCIIESIDSLWDSNLQKNFLEEYIQWIKSTERNKIYGLEKFSVPCFSLGTTEAFDKFYLKNLHRRLRYFRGEYMYHQVAARQFHLKGEFLENDEIRENDAVVISCPFSDTGCQHPLMEKVLEYCNKINVPVLFDMAYFGTCGNLTINLDHPSITDVTFSLSKSFPVPHIRIGMRLTRVDDDDTLLVMNKTGYTNRLSLSVGKKIIKNFSPDFVFDNWRDRQINLCKELKIQPSDCVIFGIDTENRYPEYNRGSTTNRLCLSKYLD